MSTTFWIVVGFVGAIVLISLTIALVLGYFIASKSRSRKMTEEQASLNKKTGASDETPSTTTPKRSGDNDKKWYIKYVWSILIVIVGVVAVYWGFQNTQIRPADAGSWSWGHWLPLLIIWGTISALIVLNKKALGEVATRLQTVLAIAMVWALVVLPLVHAIWGGGSSSQQVTRSEIPLASSPQSEWPPLSIPANGKKKIPILPGKRVTVAGYNFVLHTVYEGGRDCSGSCPDHGVIEVYVENKSATENIVVYAYTPIQ